MYVFLAAENKRKVIRGDIYREISNLNVGGLNPEGLVARKQER